MNDRFKFRLFNIKDGTYCVGVHLIGGGDMIHEAVTNTNWNNSGSFIIEQCTGLKDKNGNLIYEGDIVKIGNGSVNGEVIESDLVVEWICKIGRYNLPTWTSDVPDWSHYVEIIGNIHKQPEQKD